MATRRSRYKTRGTEQPDRHELGMRIYHLREMRGLTQAQLTERLGLSPQTVSHWESGRYMPSLVAAKRLACVFDVSLDELTRGVV